MSLPRAIRARIMAGEWPHIGGDGIAPIKAGHVWRLSAYVTVTVDRVDHRKGKWSARYTVTDSRDLKSSADRYMRRAPRPEDFEQLRETFDENGYPTPIDEAQVKSAAEESAYTSRPDLAIDPDPVPPAEYVDKLAKDAQAPNEILRVKRRREAQAQMNDAVENFRAALDAIETDDAQLRKLKRKAQRMLGEAA